MAQGNKLESRLVALLSQLNYANLELYMQKIILQKLTCSLFAKLDFIKELGSTGCFTDRELHFENIELHLIKDQVQSQTELMTYYRDKACLLQEYVYTVAEKVVALTLETNEDCDDNNYPG